LTGIHFLLTYACNYECDHCFLYCGPHSEGTFTLAQVRNVLTEAAKIETVEEVYFEGGEAFLYYPLLVESVRIARGMGFEAGIVTNAYWATSVEDAVLWLKPLNEAGLSSITMSDDSFHGGDGEDSPAKAALAAARQVGMPASSICIEEPTVETTYAEGGEKGTPVIGGGAMFRGRAVEKLTEGLPRRRWDALVECPHEELEDPGRVHVDSFGNVHLCQGLSMGNMWETPLSKLVKQHNAGSHPICGPLLRGGPALLAKEYNVEHEDGYVDECHFCYLVRLALLDRFPQYLAPRQVYGLE
jgi:hypothetical protein